MIGEQPMMYGSGEYKTESERIRFKMQTHKWNHINLLSDSCTEFLLVMRSDLRVILVNTYSTHEFS